MANVELHVSFPLEENTDSAIPWENFDSSSIATNSKKIFDAHGKCIYCGSIDNLGKEHAIPFGLGGDLILPKSSCRSCAIRTSKFELYVLRGPMWPVRAHLRLNSRRQNLAPKTAHLTIVRKGNSEVIDIPLREHPLPLLFPIFAAPSYLTGQAVDGIALSGHWNFGFGKPVPDVLRDVQADDLQFSQEYKIVPFAQLIGKIAWVMAAATGDLAKIDKRDCLVSALIEKPNEIGKWVGTLDGPRVKHEKNVLHSIVPYEDRERGFMFTEVQLFANAGTPRYGVILGALR